MQEFKIVVLGSMGAGKSTLVQTLAQGNAVMTEVRNSDPNASKEMTTVAMDYGDIDLPDGHRLRLYGSPGQERFAFLWPILLQGATGAIVLADAATGDPAALLAAHLQVLLKHDPDLPVVIGLTQCDRADAVQWKRCQAWLDEFPHPWPVVPVDVRNREESIGLMDIVMSQVESLTLVESDEQRGNTAGAPCR
ncbi:TPA: ATP/GTP-binding protein [Stenotrophomonas maltophilia]|nr:ATP/GTP-binding protein [Stenotrophomonas maltophilia]HDS1024026.1 ATP/GTP-binding protein [Stenotrophomonas maltophilia]HDS1029308.1 ATP/GTP-binding protein [Stenotrophomonas maltophilia]HDS1032789.1 ATP/GTP-binding protein [Stenotrophomonas maltophilia]